MKIVAIALLVVVCLVAVPISLVWSLNTLFGIGLAYTWQTCAAALLLAMAVNGAKK